MKTMEEKQKFIELRAKGISFDKIANELRVSKPTLLKWNQDFQKEIANLLYFQIESTLSQFRLEKCARIESMATILSKALEELRSRSMQDLSTKELLGIIHQANERLEKEVSSVRYTTDEWKDPLDSLHEEMLASKTLPLPY